MDTPLPPRALEALSTVHRRPGISRAALTRALGLSSGAASDIVATLVAAGTLAEGEPVGSGPGRPTRALWPHPEGPLVLVAAITHETWTVQVAQLGGTVLQTSGARHDRAEAAVLEAVATALSAAETRHRPRIRAIAVSVPGTVSGTRLVQAPNLGWTDVELARLRPRATLPVLADNDATWSAIGELHRGVAAGHACSLHLFMDSGVGGALIDGGRVARGARGMAGEFGHLPFGSPHRRCRCGARGCWNTDLDGRALADAMGRPTPDDEVSFARTVLAAAAHRSDPAACAAADALAAALGRGTAGLVNACDPELVVLGGLSAAVIEVAPDPLQRAYREGLMATRSAAPPPLRAGTLGEQAPLVGAIEGAFTRVLDPDGQSVGGLASPLR